MIATQQRGHGHGRGGRRADRRASNRRSPTPRAAHPELDGKSAMFLTYVDTADLSQVGFYTTHDTRAAFFDGPRHVRRRRVVADASAGADRST